MSDLLPGGLQVIAAVLAAGFVTALALAAHGFSLLLHQLYLARLGEAGPPLAHASERRGGIFAALRKTAIALLAAINQRRVPARWLAPIDAGLRRAGRPLDLEATEIAACMELSAVSFLCAGVAASRWLNFGTAYALLFAVAGACSPLLWLHDKVRARRLAITRALPWSLDLLTLSVEAGLDFAAALAKVVEKGRKGPLGDELSLTLRELKLGKTREEALRNLARRVELATLTSFVHALIQADRLGTPLGKVLRILSTQMRVERTQRAEKLANEAPVKLLFPLIAFIFPTVFIMLFGPIAFQVFGGSF